MFCETCQEEVEWDAQMGYDDFCGECQEVIDHLNEEAKTEARIAAYEFDRMF